MTKLKDKVVIITGASTGLCPALAREHARESCILALCARDAQVLELVRIELRSHGATVFTSVCDVSRPEEVDAFIEAGYAVLKNFNFNIGYRVLEGGVDNDKVFNFSRLEYIFSSIQWEF